VLPHAPCSQGVQDTEALRKAVEEVQPENVALGLRLSQSRPLYEGFRALREGEGWGQLTPAQQVGASAPRRGWWARPLPYGRASAAVRSEGRAAGFSRGFQGMGAPPVGRRTGPGVMTSNTRHHPRPAGRAKQGFRPHAEQVCDGRGDLAATQHTRRGRRSAWQQPAAAPRLPSRQGGVSTRAGPSDFSARAPLPREPAFRHTS
jgi:hypothetical protein